MLLERELLGETDVEQHTERVLIALGPHLAVHLLGRKVLRRSEDLPFLREIDGHRRLGDAEVEHLDLGARVRVGQEDVARLEIAMNDAELVAGAERGADAQHHVRHVLDGQRRFRLLEQHPEVAPPQVLHHQVGRAVVGHAEVDDLNDVAVVHLGRGQRLPHEPLAQLIRETLAGAVRNDRLERDRASEPAVDRAINGPHAPLADELVNLITIDPASFQRPCFGYAHCRRANIPYFAPGRQP